MHLFYVFLLGRSVFVSRWWCNCGRNTQVERLMLVEVTSIRLCFVTVLLVQNVRGCCWLVHGDKHKLSPALPHFFKVNSFDKHGGVKCVSQWLTETRMFSRWGTYAYSWLACNPDARVRQKLLKVLQWGGPRWTLQLVLGMKPKLRLGFETVPFIYDLSLCITQ